MVDLRTCIAAALIALASAAPAAAQWSSVETAASGDGAAPAARHKPTPSTAIPEPASIALFAAGVAGLLVGRRGSRSRHDGE